MCKSRINHNAPTRRIAAMFVLAVSGVILAAATLPAWAASTSLANAPIHIEADHAEYVERTGVSTYTGNVILTQGGLRLQGSKLTVTRNDDTGRIKAELVGHPAQLHKDPDKKGDEPVTGHAQRMRYDSTAEQIVLNGEAVVERGGNAIHGNTIRHNLVKGTTEAEGSGGDNGKRVRITIQPQTAQSAIPGEKQPPPEQPGKDQETGGKQPEQPGKAP